MAKKKKTNKTARDHQRSPGKSKVNPGISRPWIWLGAILVVGFLIYTPILNGQFLHYDDDLYIKLNPLIQTLSLENIGKLFTTFVGNQYSPVAMTIMAIEVAIFGMNAAPLKFISILLHLGNGVAVYYFVKILFKRLDLALIIAGIFTVHAMNVESVAWLTASMKISTFSLFQLLSLISYTQFVDKRKRKHFYLAMLWFVLSGLCKEQGVVLPVLLLGIDYVRDRALNSKDIWLEKLPFFVLALIISGATLMVADDQQGGNQVFPYSVAMAGVFATYAIIAYFSKLTFPFELSTVYGFPEIDKVPGWYYITPILFIAIVGIAYWAWKKEKKILLFGLFFFFVNVSLSLVAQVLSVRPIIIANRYMYLPMVGYFIFLVPLIMGYLEGRKLNRTFIFGGFALYGIMLAILAYPRARVWYDDFTFMSDAVEKAERWGRENSPIMSFVYTNLGVAYKDRGDNEQARILYRKALKCNPRYEQAYANLANAQMLAGELADAEKNYDMSLSINPENEKALSGRGAVYAQTRRYDLALSDLNKAIEIDPNHKDAYSNRFLTYYQMQRYQDALADIDKLLEFDPSDASAHHDKGVTLSILGRKQDALVAYTEAIRLAPQNGGYLFSRANLNRDLGNRRQAYEDAIRAQQLGYNVDPGFIQSVQ